MGGGEGGGWAMADDGRCTTDERLRTSLLEVCSSEARRLGGGCCLQLCDGLGDSRQTDRQTDRQHTQTEEALESILKHIYRYLIYCSSKCKVGFLRILVASEVPKLYRKLREACRENFPQVSSKSEETFPHTGLCRAL